MGSSGFCYEEMDNPSLLSGGWGRKARGSTVVGKNSKWKTFGLLHIHAIGSLHTFIWNVKTFFLIDKDINKIDYG